MTLRSPLARLVLPLVVIATFFVAADARAEVVRERISYDFRGVTYYGWLMQDLDYPTPRAAVIVFPEWWGLDDFAVEQGEHYAELGYVTFVADLYGLSDEGGENVVADTPEEAQTLASRLYGDRTRMKQLATAAYMQVAKLPAVDPSRIALVGYGLGGTVAIEVARTSITAKAVVVFHGSLGNPAPETTANVRGEVLVFNGADDPYIPQEEIDEFRRLMDETGRAFTMVEISGAQQSFMNRRADYWGIEGASYSERAASIAHSTTEAFLERVLGGPRAGTRIDEDE